MLVLGSDHGGFLLKQEIKKHLEERGIAFPMLAALMKILWIILTLQKLPATRS